MEEELSTSPQGAAASPLLAIWNEIEVAAFDLAPERTEALEAISKSFRIRVVVELDQGTFHFSANPATGQISLGLAALERLWAYSMAYGYVIHRSTMDTEEGLISLAVTPEGIDAMRLLGWAHLGEQRKERLPWPSNLPKPAPHSPRGSFGELANGLFRKSLGWIILHEVGHVVHQHRSNTGRLPSELVKEEEEADRWAFDWVLHDGDVRRKQDPTEFLRRTLGITCALGLIATFEVYDRTQGVDHPDPPDRLWNFLERYVPYELASPVSPAFAWRAAVSIVKLHLDHGRVPVETEAQYPDSKACLSDLLRALKRHRT